MRRRRRRFCRRNHDAGLRSMSNDIHLFYPITRKALLFKPSFVRRNPELIASQIPAFGPCALPCSHHPITLRRPPNPRHLQPGPHQRSRESADTLPPAVDEAKRQALHGGVYGYDIYAAFSVCIGPSFPYSREYSKSDEGYKGGKRGS